MNEEIPAILQPALKSARLRHYPRGQIILHAGDLPADTFVLKTGAVKIYDIDEQGNEKILHIVKAPAVVPFVFFSGVENATNWFYTALIDSDLYVLPKAQLIKRLHEDSSLTIFLMNWFSQEVHELLVRLSSLSKTHAQDKLIAALKFLAARHTTRHRSGWLRVNFPVSHQLLADMSGVTRESAAVAMKDLQERGVVRHPRFTILEIKLERLIDQTNPAS